MFLLSEDQIVSDKFLVLLTEYLLIPQTVLNDIYTYDEVEFVKSHIKQELRMQGNYFFI